MEEQKAGGWIPGRPVLHGVASGPRTSEGPPFGRPSTLLYRGGVIDLTT